MANGTQDKVRELQTKLYQAAKLSPTRRFHALFDKVHRPDFLWRVWLDVARNGGAPGVDGVAIDHIEERGTEGVREFLDALAAELEGGTYRPLPVRRVTIPKSSGGERHLGVPALRDRVVQAATEAVIEPIFEADFLDCSYGFRPGRSAHQAMDAIKSEVNRGRVWVVGWCYQWICQLNWAPDSWTAPLDALRISPSMDAATSTIEQVEGLVDLLPDDAEVPLLVFDAGYDGIALGHGLRNTRAEVLVRIASTRVFHPDPTPRESGAMGRPRRHGPRFVLADEETWTTPDAELITSVRRYGNVKVSAWHNLHPKLHGRGRWRDCDEPPIIKGSIIRVEVEHLPKPTGRIKKTLWLWWSGNGEPDLDRCWRAYLRRFDIEHTFRFVKGTLGWTTPSLQMPEQADRWTWIVIAAYTQLRLARQLVDDLRLPWEPRCDPKKLTPARVRRGFRRLRATLGTPAHPPKSSTPGPGRPKGTRKPPRTRYPAVKKPLEQTVEV